MKWVLAKNIVSISYVTAVSENQENVHGGQFGSVKIENAHTLTQSSQHLGFYSTDNLAYVQHKIHTNETFIAAYLSFGNISKCLLLTDYLGELCYICTVEYYANSSQSDDFYTTDLEQSLRLKTQGAEENT